MDTQREQLLESLNTADTSEAFLLAIIVSVFLSLKALILQREGICAALEGEQADLSLLYPIRHTASSITAGGLGYFLCLAARTLAGTDPSDPVAVHSAQSNLLAAMLVFLAAGIRWDDIQFLRANGRL